MGFFSMLTLPAEVSTLTNIVDLIRWKFGGIMYASN